MALALLCAQSDARLIGRAKMNDDALWEQADGGMYQTLFHPVPDAQFAWNTTVLLRGIVAETEVATARRTGRARAFAQHADWLICHILLRLIDQNEIKAADPYAWREQVVQSRRRYDQILDRLIHHADAQYSTDAYPESTFRDETRCKVLAGLVLADIRNDAAAPQLQQSDRRRERARNAVDYIHDAQLLSEGTILQFTSRSRTHGELIDTWTRDHPEQARVTWTADRRRPLLWETDGKRHAPSPLAVDIIEQITGRRPKSVRGPDCWVAPDGRTLTQLAEEAKRRVADSAT